MLVAIDVEWIGEEGRERLTQISARKYQKGWVESGSFQALMHFPECSPAFFQHVAFTGYAPSAFQGGEPEEDALDRLAGWLQADDTLCFWCGTGKNSLNNAWRKHFAKCLPYRTCLAKAEVLKALRLPRGSGTNPYQLLGSLGESLPGKEHCSENDVEALGSLLRLSGLTVLNLKKISVKLKEPARKAKKVKKLEEINQHTIDSCRFNYIFLKESKIFHTTDCACMRKAQSLLGSVYYKTAADGRRPCKICQPVDEDHAIESRMRKPAKVIPPAVIEAMCGNREPGTVNGISPKKMLQWKEMGAAYGLSFYCQQENRYLYYMSDVGFWQIHWNSMGGFVLFHLNHTDFDNNKTACELARGHFHRQKDVPVRDNLGAILFYIRDHDKAKKIIADDFRKLPRKTKRERRYYHQACSKAERSRKRRLYELLDQVAAELREKEDRGLLQEVS